MSYGHHPDARLTLKVGRRSWLFFLFLTAVFFVNYHDLSNNYHNLSNVRGGRDSYNASVDDITSSIDKGSIVRRITLLSLGIVAIVSLVHDRTNRRLRVDSPLGWLLLGFVVWAFISPIWAEDLALTLRRLAVFGILCIAAVAVARRLSLREIILFTFFSTTLGLFVGIAAEVLYGTFRPFTFGYRFAGSLHPNGQGIECGLLVLSALAAADLGKRWRAFFRACAFLGFVFLILTWSRTAIAAAILTLVGYLVAVGSRRLKIAMAYSFSIFFCLLLLFLGAGLLPGLKSAIQLGRDDAGDADSFNGRTMVWEDVGYYIRQRPILGYGYCGFWTPAHIRAVSDEENWAVPDGHSTYIDYLVSLGIVGLVAYTFLLFAGIRRAFRFHRLSRNSAFAFCGALLVFFALDGFLESALFEGSLIMFLCMVVLVRLAFLCWQEAIRVANP
jgi:exopolysaccharide production protein ExoQ